MTARRRPVRGVPGPWELAWRTGWSRPEECIERRCDTWFRQLTASTVILITQWFLPFSRSKVKPGPSYLCRAPLYRNDGLIFLPGVPRVALDLATSRSGDQLERTERGDRGKPTATMALVHVDAGDPVGR